MAEVDSVQALLVNALQDLHDAARAMTERLPQAKENSADNQLRDLLKSDAADSASHSESLADLLRAQDAETDGAPNIWLRAILDDADRDAETVAKGALLDIALTGAIRKGKQSQRVSYETAMALAARLQDAGAEATLTNLRDAAEAVDEQLKSILVRLCGEG